MARSRKTRIGSLGVAGCDSEEQDQARVVMYLDKLGKLFYAVPNGGKRGHLEAIRLQRGGVRAGVPDLVIPEPVGDYHGMYLEMKREKKSSLKPHQAYWLEQLCARGYYAVCAKGFDEAFNHINHYFGIKS